MIRSLPANLRQRLWPFMPAVLACGIMVGTARNVSAQTPLSESRALSQRGPEGELSQQDKRAQLIPELTIAERDHFRLLLNGDTRIRGEVRLNQDQDRKRADDDQFALVRSRLSADLTWRRNARLFLEAMDARELGSNFPRNQENDFDSFHQAFVELAPDHPSPWSVRGGLQEIRLGRDHRLFNSASWNNLRRTHLGARLMRRTENWDLDLFLVQPRTNSIKVDGESGSGNERLLSDQYVYGAHSTLRLGGDHELETYAYGHSDRSFRRGLPTSQTGEDGTLGSLERYTVGLAAYGPIATTGYGNLTYGAGGAWQFGTRATDELRAYMAHGELAHEFDKAKWKPRLSLDAFLASGDQENNDGIQGSFNNLYGSNSGLYSRSQLFRGSNLRMLGPTMRVKPTDKLNIALSARQFWVDSDTDAWVDAGGNRLARDRTGRDSTGLGHEVAVNGTFELNKWTRLEAGVSATVPGAYAASFGRDDTYIFGYTGVSINF